VSVQKSLGIPAFTTERLILRQWQQSDLSAFAALNDDPDVMAYMPKRLTKAESDALATRISDHIANKGWGLWAVEVRGGSSFIGFVGLWMPSFTAHFTPCVEIGWRLAKQYWGYGYAIEAARVSVTFGFEVLQLPEIVSFTAVGNQRSRNVMERLGMRHNPTEDFTHPSLPSEHSLSRHVLYRLPNSMGQR
jgi:RimJ/RimL family protein N-acetyltransferase